MKRLLLVAHHGLVLLMFLRIVAILIKSAVMVALLELFSPVAEAVGLQFHLLQRIATAFSHSTAMPYKQAEVLLLFFLATALLETGQFLWDLATR